MTAPKLTRAEVGHLRSLSTRKGRDRHSSFLVEGWNVVGDARAAGWDVARIVVHPSSADTRDKKDLLRSASEAGVAVVHATAAELQRVSGTEHAQGVVAEVRQRKHRLDDLVGHDRIIVVALDGVSDPGNVGTLIRTADWFGATGVLLGEGSASLYNDKVVRSTAGSIFHIPVVEGIPLPRALRWLRERGCSILGTSASGTTPLPSLPAHRKAVLLLGSEAHGISRPLLSLADQMVVIPRLGRAESLNVAVAGAVILSRLTAGQPL